MARAFDSTIRALLRSPNLAVNVLATFYLDSGTYYFCDDIINLYDGTHTYIGANALAEAAEIRSSQDLSAEQVTLILDGNRMAQYGIVDPARVLADLLGYLYQQRRVDYAFGFRANDQKDIQLIIPAYAGKINSARLIDNQIDFAADEGSRTSATLEIVLDALAARYSRTSSRTRSHPDQQEIDNSDMFYSFTTDTVINQRKIYWGKDAPFGYNGGYGYGGGVDPNYAVGRYLNRYLYG